MSTVIALTRGKSTVVDDEDVAVLAGWRWRAVYRNDKKLWYVAGYRGDGATREDVYMHRLLTSASSGEVIDHKDGDGLNNRSSNFRRCTVRQNVLNTRIRPHSSRYKGVYWSKRDRVWRAQIGLHRKVLSLGQFKIERDAALAYNKAANEHFGEFAKLNEVSQ